MNKNSQAEVVNNSHLRDIDLFYIAMAGLEEKHGNRSSMLKVGMIDAFISYLKTSGYEVAKDALYFMLYVTGEPIDTTAPDFRLWLLESRMKLLEAKISEANEKIIELTKQIKEGI
jgi:hypothetical protein